MVKKQTEKANIIVNQVENKLFPPYSVMVDFS